MLSKKICPWSSNESPARLICSNSSFSLLGHCLCISGEFKYLKGYDMGFFAGGTTTAALVVGVVLVRVLPYLL